MSSSELAHYVFEHHGCDGCHTLGANGKLGFTERGKLVGKGFEGCIAQLTAMSAIVQVKETDRTAEQKHKVARFEEFGCTTCHQVAPGKLGLTTYGTKLKSLHMACTDVEKTLATRKSGDAAKSSNLVACRSCFLVSPAHEPPGASSQGERGK